MLGKNLQKLISKNFSAATKAKIKFLGKRSLLPQDYIQNSHTVKETSSNNNSNNKHQETKSSLYNPLSNFTLNSYRVSLSNEEIEVINNGGPLNLPDWNKIKLKPKVKKI